MRPKRSAESDLDESESTALGLTGLLPAPTLVGWAGHAAHPGRADWTGDPRRIKPLPRRPSARTVSSIGRGQPRSRDRDRDRKTSAFIKYRSISNTTVSSDGLSEQLDPSQDETATTLSDVESEILASIHTLPAARDQSQSFLGSLDDPDDEGDEIDLALVATPTSSRARSESYSPALPASTPPSYRADTKGKAVDPREHAPSRRKRPRATEDTGSGSEGDDESVNVHPMPHKKKRAHRPCPLPLASTNFGPTRSILDITMGIDCLGEFDIEYCSDDVDDARLVSASLISLDEPMPLASARRTRVGPNHNRALRRQNAKVDLYADLHARQPRRPRAVRRPCLGAPSPRSTSDDDDDDDKMITSEIERDMVDHERRTRCRESVARLPGQQTSARLRRLSPTSLLAMREKQRQFGTSNRLVSKLHLTQRHSTLGQVVLANMADARESRDKRRTAVQRMNAKYDFASTALLPAFKIQSPVGPLALAPPPAATRRPRGGSHPGSNFNWSVYQLDVIRRKRQQRDQRRIAADKKISQHRVSTPVRVAAPLISPSFAPLSFCSPALAAVEDEVGDEATSSSSIDIEETDRVNDDDDEQQSVQDVVCERTPSPTLSDPPEYEDRPMPITLVLPRHLRPRPPPRAVGNQVPAYPWLSHLSGGEYTRLSPPPPPPFNAQTDAETIIAPRFIESDDEDDEMLERILPGRVRSDPSSQRFALGMVGAFPSPSAPSDSSSVRESSPAVLSPAPIRWTSSPLAGMRTPWEAALDLEEGEEDEEDIMEDVFEADAQDEDVAEQALEQSSSALSAFGRLVGRVWRW